MKSRRWMLAERPKRLRTPGAVRTPAMVEFRTGVGTPREPAKFSMIFEEGKKALISFLTARKDKKYKSVLIGWLEGGRDSKGQVEDVFEKRMLVYKGEVLLTVKGASLDELDFSEEEGDKEGKEYVPPEISALKVVAPPSAEDGLARKILAEARFISLILCAKAKTEPTRPAEITICWKTKKFNSLVEARGFCVAVLSRFTDSRTDREMIKTLDWFSNV